MNWGAEHYEAAMICFITVPFFMQLEEKVLLLIEPKLWKSYAVVVYVFKENKEPLKSLE